MAPAVTMRLTCTLFRPAYICGMRHWIAHRVVSAIIHGVIYGFIFKAMHQMTTGEAAILAVVVVAVLFMWGRLRNRRGW